MMSKVVLLYPPQQARPDHPHKPEASLAYPYLAGALLAAGHDVSIYDACVGNERDNPDVFYSCTELESGLNRYGVSDDRILEEVAGADAVGITSIFTAQESMALAAGRLIRKHFPSMLLMTGGTNARSRYKQFLQAGFTTVCMTEAERDIVKVVEHSPRRILATQEIDEDLDTLPMPAWKLHPNDRYWEIGRPHGAKHVGQFRYASMMTSRGCMSRCLYCHISGDGKAARFRAKSLERVRSELQRLQDIGVTDVFLEDDTLFGRKQRAVDLLRHVRGHGFRLWDINGVNIRHLFCHEHGRYVPDCELLDVLQECGFCTISLPVESGSQRVIDYYASRKWRLDQLDVGALIRAMEARGIAAGVNYMIGFPDETRTEIEATLDLAREHMQAGARSANVMLAIPLPGTRLHDEAIDKGYLDADFNPDTFNWRQASMTNTTVAPEELEEIQRTAWETLN